MYMLKKGAFLEQNQDDKHSPKMNCQMGSIMLEVVAVLALMGVMGAMLFRQIYQRNQELHNIQMASEIRTVKEALAAYIQANRSSIIRQCNDPADDDEVAACPIIDPPCADAESIYCGVQNYLPDGWFSVDDLERAYSLSIWNYKVNEKRVVYGIVIPTASTLPTTGWNFRRAARVALLIGADGGAYDPTITNGNIAGSLGSWQISLVGLDIPQDDDGDNLPTYVAMTGIDIFAPEYDAGTGTINLPHQWDLALRDLHAYDYFSVGNSGPSGCYTIHHDTFENPDQKNSDVKSDDITTPMDGNCKPLFWVGDDNGGVNSNAGNVYVQNDLNVGADMNGSGDHALKLTKEGVIQQRDGLTIDKDGRIIAKDTVSATVGDVQEGEHFVLDPAYTSTMNDIRLTSRGGARLSEILPDYISKEQGERTCQIPPSGAKTQCSTPVPVPQCPTGYTHAIKVSPKFVLTNNSNYEDTAEFLGGIVHDRYSLQGPGADVTIDSANISQSGGSVDNVTIPQNSIQSSLALNPFKISVNYDSSNKRWTVYGEYTTGVNANKDVKLRYETFCVWRPVLYSTEESCEAAGFTWDGTCTSTLKIPVENETGCESAGFIWDTTNKRCQYTYDVDKINAISDSHLKGTVCKAAGFTWNGTNCTKPSS